MAVAGCGDGGGGKPVAPRPSGPAAAGRYLQPAELTTQLGNGFRAGLYHLAVMSQQEDDAPDLGQQLPTGVLERVRCSPAGVQPARGAWPWRCSVAWRTVAHSRQTTRYAVTLTPRGCFSATARPNRDARYDATIHSYSVDPLNILESLRRGC